MLFEQKRDIRIEPVDGDTRAYDVVPAAIQVIEDKKTGGIRLEVCLNRIHWTSTQVVDRKLELDEVTKLWTWGNKLREYVEAKISTIRSWSIFAIAIQYRLGNLHETTARYKWMSDIVRLRATEEMEFPLKEMPVGDECKRFKVIFGDFDNKEVDERQYLGSEIISCLKEKFAKSQTNVSQETQFNLRTGYMRPDMEDRRKDLEIESARKRHGLYENTSRALYDWYVRLDVSGDGQLDVEEFASFLRAVVQTYGQSMDDDQVRRHWREMRTITDCIGFTQFVNYLFFKFPHIRTMTAFEIKRFEERSKKSQIEAAVRRRDSMFTLKSFKTAADLSRAEKEGDKGRQEGDEATGGGVYTTQPMALSRKTRIAVASEAEISDSELPSPRGIEEQVSI